MSFASPEFVIFYAIAVAIYYITPFRFRWVLLLAASYFFYAYWNSKLIILILLSTSVDYVAARIIDGVPIEQIRSRRFWLAISVILNLSILFTFKYYNFFITSANELLHTFGFEQSLHTLQLILPVGISFYTFQSMAYTIDVYRGKIAAEKHFGIFALYISFFPQIIAGPIERASKLLPQFRQDHHFDYDQVILGLRIVLWGFFKKIVIADRLAPYVNVVYANPDSFDGLIVITASLFFIVQMYCDFSGYADIAIGTARIMGFKLSMNFRQPFLSPSITIFWQRWHITLLSWFMDYVYIPLGASRISPLRTFINIMIVFTISGLWHGANWTFVLYGAANGALIVIERIWRMWKGRPRLPRLILILQTMMIGALIVTLFRASSVEIAFSMMRSMFDLSNGFDNISIPFTNGVVGPNYTFLSVWVSIAILFIYDIWDSRSSVVVAVGKWPRVYRWTGYYALLILIYLAIVFGSVIEQFIYFQF